MSKSHNMNRKLKITAVSAGISFALGAALTLPVQAANSTVTASPHQSTTPKALHTAII